ncbi:histidine phosphatase family protein [Georgenia sp. Z1344]|uniref:histidine phosphatase family protein n=1 Tax=Georgenia sp. Z1344 TaxID=3416706 RepID=UPI003CF8A077
MTEEKAPPPTLVLLVRHGTTPTTGRVMPGRAPGLNLSDRGRDQAERVGERVAAASPSAIYSSPLERARQTAEPLARRTGLAVVEEPGLLESDVGDWTGEPLADLARLPAWRTVQERPAEFRFPGGESLLEMQERMAATLESVRAEHAGSTVACFSHADPIKAALSYAFDLSLDRFQRLTVSPCSVSAIAYPAAGDGVHGDPVVLTVNSTLESLGDLRIS